MADLDLLTEIHTDVKYIKQGLQKHINDCEQYRRDKTEPMWNTYQRGIGMKTIGALAITFLGAVVGYFKGHH